MNPPTSTDNGNASTVVLAGGRSPDGRHVDIHVVDGAIAAVEPAGTGLAGDRSAATVHELGGRLVLPALAEPHAHVDKALTADVVENRTGDLIGAIDGWIEAAARGTFTHDDIVSRSVRALELLVLHGATAVRTHVNVGESIGATHVRAVREARERLAGIVDVQIVALTTSPMTGPDGAGNRAALAEALEVGVDVVGGCPHLDVDPPEVIRAALRAATEAGLDVDLHTDETLDASMLTLPEIARQVEATGFEGSVTASHCVSLGMQPPDVQRDVARRLAGANVAVVTLPQTNLFLQGREHPTATPRGLTAVRPLLDAGVVLAAGADNVQDPFNPMGRSDPLETAALMVMAGHLAAGEAFELVSGAVRATMGLPPVRVEVGGPADLLAIGAANVRGALADAPHDRLVFRRGRLVARSEETRSIVR